MDEILRAFIDDGRERLGILEAGLLRLEDGVRDPATLNAVFRAAHTIKGDAGVVDLPGVEHFTHGLETYLELVRRGSLPLGPQLISLLLAGCDQLNRLISRVEAGLPEADPAVDAAGRAILEQLAHLADGGSGEASQGPESPRNLALAQPENGDWPMLRPTRSTDKHPVESHQIRVQTEKLDALVDMVGELVIASAAASLRAEHSRQTDLVEANEAVAFMVAAVRRLTLQLRMVKIGDTFGRFQRMVRDMAQERGEDIELQVSGQDTELDKSIVDRIADPLVHLIRNAVDHGIEPAAVRLAAGKPATGRVSLTAYHDAGGVVIAVADDGAGINLDKILARAQQAGLVPPGQTPPDQELVDLIFAPGFSTADQVTNLSGRGVGMDVVRSNVQALGGTVEVESRRGQGSRFAIRLPLTLSIIDGFLVSVEHASFVVPLNQVVQCADLPGQNAHLNYLTPAGVVTPCIPLRRLFTLGGERPKREYLLVVRQGAKQVALVVDQLHGEVQAVVKPLTSLFRELRGIAGATILGTGEVALILDVPDLIRLAVEAAS